MSKLFHFLEETLPNAANCANQMEELFFIDINSSISKARIFIEEIINSVLNIEKIDLTMANLDEKIRFLHNEEVINPEIQLKFNHIRRIGNKVVHNVEIVDIKEAYIIHREMYDIAKWYMEVYTIKDTYSLYKQPQQNQSNSLDFKKIVESLLEEKLNKYENISIKKEDLVETEEFENDISIELRDLDDVKNIELQNNIEDKAINVEIDHSLIPTEKINSLLYRELKKLNIISSQAIENATTFSKFKDYLHINRPIYLKILDVLENRRNKQKGNLILLCGSVGDGKSHLLAYLNKNYKDQLEDYIIFNDATESFSPSKTALETLEETLKDFSDQNINNTKTKLIIAINMGILSNFINREHENYTYDTLKEFIISSGLFSSEITTNSSNDHFDLISFTNYSMYELTNNGPTSSYFKSLVKKITQTKEDNPFYNAYLEDIKNKRETIIHQNYKLLCDETVQENIVNLVIEVMIKFKHTVSSRHFLNFISDILIASNYHESENLVGINYLRLTLPYLLFNSNDRSALLDFIAKINPIHNRNQWIDEIYVSMNTLNNWDESIKKSLIENKQTESWYKDFFVDTKEYIEDYPFLVEQIINSLYIINKDFNKQCSDLIYREYVEYLYAFNKNILSKKRKFYQTMNEIIYNWKFKSNSKSNIVYLNFLSEKIISAQELKLNNNNECTIESTETILNKFQPYITISYKKDNDENIQLNIDFTLFSILSKVAKGYRLNKKDDEEVTTFIKFMENLMELGSKNEYMYFNFIEEEKKYILKVDDFNPKGFVFERVK